jgi:hypothetical protein
VCAGLEIVTLRISIGEKYAADDGCNDTGRTNADASPTQT